MQVVFVRLVLAAIFRPVARAGVGRVFLLGQARDLARLDMDLVDISSLKGRLPVLAGAAWLAFFGDKAPAGKNADVVGAVVPQRSSAVPPRTAGSVAGTVTAVAPGGTAAVSNAPASPRNAYRPSAAPALLCNEVPL